MIRLVEITPEDARQIAKLSVLWQLLQVHDPYVHPTFVEKILKGQWVPGLPEEESITVRYFREGWRVDNGHHRISGIRLANKPAILKMDYSHKSALNFGKHVEDEMPKVRAYIDTLLK